MDTEVLKQELIEILEDIDKEHFNLCDLKEYAEIVKVVSEIKGRDYTEVFAQMIGSDGPMMGGGNMKALGGSMTIREMKGKHHDRDRGEDDD